MSRSLHYLSPCIHPFLDGKEATYASSSPFPLSYILFLSFCRRCLLFLVTFCCFAHIVFYHHSVIERSPIHVLNHSVCASKGMATIASTAKSRGGWMACPPHIGEWCIAHALQKPLRCIGSCTALHWPTHRSAFPAPPACVPKCSALHQPSHASASPHEEHSIGQRTVVRFSPWREDFPRGGY